MEAAFVFIVLLIGLFGVLFFYLLGRHRERMSLIENGADAKLFKTEARKKPYFFSMLLGILFICLALGIGIGYWIDISTYTRVIGNNPVPYFVSIFFFLGVGFITAYLIHKRELLKD